MLVTLSVYRVFLPLREIDGQAPYRLAPSAEPVGQLLSELFRLRVLFEPLGPELERGRLRREGYLLAAARLLVARVQVFEQHAPGDAVNEQVMNDEKEPSRPRVAEVEKRGTGERPFAEVEPALEAFGRLGD